MVDVGDFERSCWRQIAMAQAALGAPQDDHWSLDPVDMSRHALDVCTKMVRAARAVSVEHWDVATNSTSSDSSLFWFPGKTECRDSFVFALLAGALARSVETSRDLQVGEDFRGVSDFIYRQLPAPVGFCFWRDDSRGAQSHGHPGWVDPLDLQAPVLAKDRAQVLSDVREESFRPAILAVPVQPASVRIDEGALERFRHRLGDALVLPGGVITLPKRDVWSMVDQFSASGMVPNDVLLGLSQSRPAREAAEAPVWRGSRSFELYLSCLGSSGMAVPEDRARAWARWKYTYMAMALFFRTCPDVTELWYLPAHGIPTADGRSEMCPGGVLIWCGSDTLAAPWLIQQAHSYIAQRRLALDFARRAANNEWREMVNGLTHALNEPISGLKTKADETKQTLSAARHAHESCRVPATAELLARCEAQLTDLEELLEEAGMMAELVTWVRNSKAGNTTGGQRYALQMVNEADANWEGMTAQWLQERLARAAKYVDLVDGFRVLRSGLIKHHENNTIFWGVRGAMLALSREKLVGKWLGNDLGLLRCVVTEILINAIRHAEYLDDQRSIWVTVRADQQCEFVVANCAQEECQLFDSLEPQDLPSAALVGARRHGGLTLLRLVLDAAGWTPLVYNSRKDDAPQWLSEMVNGVAVYQAVGFQARVQEG